MSVQRSAFGVERSGEAGRAVFLSYASQDAEAARRLCEALRGAGVEVWFDAEGGLEHGDEWDAKIRRQIKECVLFLPIISANTQARLEGYFRIEWELAAQRSLGIASGVPFILPVAIDATREAEALVPDRFRSVQWTRLPGGNVPPEVLTRLLKLWSHRTGVLNHQAAKAAAESAGLGSPAVPANGGGSGKSWVICGVVAACLGVAAAIVWSRREPSTSTGAKSSDSLVTSNRTDEAERLIARVNATIQRLNYTPADLAAAETLARQATELMPDSARAWSTRAYVSSIYVFRRWDRSDKRRQETETWAARALAFDANEAPAMLALAEVYNAQRAYGQMEIFARRAMMARPDDPIAARVLVSALDSLGRNDEAEALRAQSAERFPRDALTLYGMANGKIRFGDFAGALSHVESALAVEPFPSALLLKARLLAAWKGDVAGARAALDAIKPDHRTEARAVGTAMWIGLLERRLDRVQEAAGLTAETYVEDFVVSGPKAVMVAMALRVAGREALAQQQWRIAESVVRERLRTSPEDTIMQAHLALSIAWQGRADEAPQLLNPLEAVAREQAASRLFRTAAITFEILARCYAGLGDAAKTVTCLRATGPLLETTYHPLVLEPWWEKVRDQPEFAALVAEAKAKHALQTSPSAEKVTNTGPRRDEKSVAVLAFDNLSDDKANEYFSDGISEEVLNALSKVPGLKVSARTSAFSFKGKGVGIREVARQLGVEYVVEGSVRKAGSRVRVTAQLIKAADGFRVWSESFDRELKDIFAVQDEIAGLVAQNLSLKLGAPQGSASRTVNAEAYQLYLQSRSRWHVNDAANVEAERFLLQALAVDLKFARAHAGLSDVWRFRGQGDRSIGKFSQRDGPVIRRMIESAQRALALEPDLAEGRQALGAAYWMAWRFDEAEKELRTAVELNPNYAWGHHGLGRVLLVAGKVEEGVAALRRAAELDPLSSRVADNFAMALRCAGRLSEALAQTDRAVALDGTNDQALSQKALILAESGRGPEALAVNESVIRMGVRLTETGVVFALLGQRPRPSGCSSR